MPSSLSTCSVCSPNSGEVDHPERGKYLTVGNPIKLSDSPSEVTRSPLLGEHTDEILREIGLSADEVAAAKTEGAV